MFEDIDILNLLMEKAKGSNEMTVSRKQRARGYMGMTIEFINHVIDRTEKNDDILKYCESSYILTSFNN